MEIGTFQMGEVGEKSFCNKYGSSIFGSKWHFNTPYHVNVEKYKAALESLKNKTYIKFEDGVQSVVFSFEVWRGSYSNDYYYTFYAFPGTKGNQLLIHILIKSNKNIIDFMTKIVIFLNVKDIYI